MKSSAQGALVLLLLLLLGSSASAIQRPASVDEARACVQAITARKSTWKSLDPEAQARERAQAVEDYRAIRRRFPLAREECAEAAFRAAELLRGMGDLPGARRELLVASDQPAGVVYRYRALLELGHWDRRERAYESALRHLASLERDALAPIQLRDEASYWIGSIECAQGRLADARRTWKRLAEHGEDPLDRIRAYDRIAQLAIDEGDLEAAAGLLDQCRNALLPIAEEQTRTGERVRLALAAMRALEELPRAVERRARQRNL
jgi:hypothetical protein